MWWPVCGKCMGQCTQHTCKHTHVTCVVFTTMPGLIFAKLFTNIDGWVGFIRNDSNYDGSLRVRCYGNRLLVRVGEKWHTPSSVNHYSAIEARLQRNIEFTLRGDLPVFTRSAITPPTVNRFGWNLEHSEHIVGGWRWQILDAIRACSSNSWRARRNFDFFDP